MKKTAKLDFEECIRTYFTEKPEITSKTKPKILFSFFYSHLDSNHQIDYNMKSSCKIPSNLHLVGASKVELDFDFHVEQAEKIFHHICPSEVFLPKPPAQEDIIFDNNEGTTVNETNLENILNTNEIKLEQSGVENNQDDLKQ